MAAPPPQDGGDGHHFSRRSLNLSGSPLGSSRHTFDGFLGTPRGSLSRNSGAFSRVSNISARESDEEELKWAALQKLPEYELVRRTILSELQGGKIHHKQVDLTLLDASQHQALIKKLFEFSSTEEDHQRFLRKFRDRIDKAGVKLPTVEVRYENYSVEAKAFAGGRALPTLWNNALNVVEGCLDLLHIPVTRKIKIDILQGVSGVIKPGRMTLLLGPPGSGKTSLLLSLAGKLDPDLKTSGKITFNGLEFHEFMPRRTSAYISQHDLHVPEMTVRETLDFSARCQGIGRRYDLLNEILNREREIGIMPGADVDFFVKGTALHEVNPGLITEYTMKILGLDICADILVGDDMIRGISGGQKKRVTTGEMIVGPTKTLFMDEISTGLDSSTTFQVVQCFRDTCRMLESTIVVSLLQPAPETFDLFDDVILLSEGRVAYHGPCENVVEFFESCGFKCPERKGIADFLQEVTSRKDQEQYWADKSKPYRFVPVREFADIFQKFHAGAKLEEYLAVPYDKAKSHPAALAFERYSVSSWLLFKANFKKEAMLMRRNSFLYAFRIMQVSVLALITMSLFFRTQMTRNDLGDAQMYASALFFGIFIIMFNGYAEITLTIVRLPVFFKQKDLLFFPAWTFAFAKAILQIPVSIVESLIWCIFTYYTSGFEPAASRFFRQLFLYIWVHQMASALFRMIAAFCRTLVISNTGGSFALLVVFVCGGFVVPRTNMKAWWIWGYWFSPMSYAQNGVNVIEFLSPHWRKPFGSSQVPLGVQYLKQSGFFPRGFWYWISVAVMVGYTFLFNCMFALALTYLNPLDKPQAVVSEETLAEQHVNLTGEVLPSLDKAGFPSRSSIQSMAKSKKSTLPRSLSAKADGSEKKQNSFASSENEDLHGENRAEADHAVQMARISKDYRNSLELDNVHGVTAKRGMILPFTPLAISFHNVNYSVDMPTEMRQQGATEDKLQLLTGITGAFRPGVLTALVGVSGAGKTTLMDVLAGRKTGGSVEGDIRISGFPKVQETFARISGYCEQNDIHSPQVSVYESLIYSAWLRLPSNIDDTSKRQFVTEVMELVELTPIKDAIVGLPGVTGLSTEQRKRLTIAVELVANPSIIFMDEPTSGLDARAAAIVMRTVRNTVDTGRTVVCTIHQPSIDIFEAFDELLLMKRGGQVIYAGPMGRHSHRLVEYFEAVHGVPKIKEGNNPATWMLEVSSVSVEQRLQVNFADIYTESALFQRNKALVEELSIPAPNSKDLWFSTQYSQPFFSQVSSCLWKQHLTYWRSPSHNNVRILFTLLAALAFGSIFWKFGKHRGTQYSIYSILGAMYAGVLFLGVNNASTVQPVVSVERTVFYRERAAGMYSAIPYGIAQVLIEIPYCFIQTILFSVITYSMIGLEWNAPKFFWYIFFLFFTFLYFTYYGMMAVGLTPNQQVATITATLFYGLFNLFSGFMIPKPRIPIWWVWYYWANPVAYSMYGIIVSQFGDIHDPLIRVDGTETTVLGFVREQFGYRHSYLNFVAVMPVVFSVLFGGIFILSIKFLNFQRR